MRTRIREVRAALEAAGVIVSEGRRAGLSSGDSALWTELVEALDRASEISEAICEVPREEDGEDDEDEEEESDAGEGGEVEADGDEEDEEGEEDDEGERFDIPEGWERVDGLWWTREKLPRWVAAVPRIEVSVERVIAMLVHWGRFDPKTG
jgi:hypothetical protein